MYEGLQGHVCLLIESSSREEVVDETFLVARDEVVEVLLMHVVEALVVGHLKRLLRGDGGRERERHTRDEESLPSSSHDTIQLT